MKLRPEPGTIPAMAATELATAFTERRFTAGQEVVANGLFFRTVPRPRSRNGVVMEVQIPNSACPHCGMASEGPWKEVSRKIPILLTDYHYEVEEVTHPRSQVSPKTGEPFEGGEFFMNRLRYAIDHGWQKAWEITSREEWWANH